MGEVGGLRYKVEGGEKSGVGKSGSQEVRESEVRKSGVRKSGVGESEDRQLKKKTCSQGFGRVLHMGLFLCDTMLPERNESIAFNFSCRAVIFSGKRFRH